jgi:hypothetical protein
VHNHETQATCVKVVVCDVWGYTFQGDGPPSRSFGRIEMGLSLLVSLGEDYVRKLDFLGLIA